MFKRMVFAGACALSLLTASPAFAGSNESIHTKGGVVTFEHRDEVVRADDIRTDGKGVAAVLVWSDATGINRTVWVIDATGNDIFSKSKDLSISEGTRVALTLCYIGKTGPGKCSRPQSARA